MAEIKSAVRKREDAKIVRLIDGERDALHRRLRILARALGKDPQDVDIDVLAADGNLAEYGLPEFSVLRTMTSLRYPSFRLRKDKGWRSLDISEPEIRNNLAEFSVFIPFGEDRAWHLFDNELFFQREPEGLERRRRAEAASKAPGFDLRYLEIESQDTFHNGVKMFGVAVRPGDATRFIAYLGEFRREYSIQNKFLPRETVLDDFCRILAEDIETIRDYLTENAGGGETAEYLLERYGRGVLSNRLSPELRQAAESILEKAGVEIEVEKALETDERYQSDKYEKFLESPKQESMGKPRSLK